MKQNITKKELTMKNLTIFTALILFSASSFSGELDGMKFCRSILSDGMFGQPPGIRLHCLSFGDDKVSDNANTFFGNPPEVFSYIIQDQKIINIEKNQETSYELENGNIIIKGTGAVLEKSQI